jgi:hypothetical protein
MALKLRNWKVVAAAAGIAAIVVVAVVLIAQNVAWPEHVLAKLDGQPITREEVEARQKRHWDWYRLSMNQTEALEEIIADRLLYREAEAQGHALPTGEEAEQELERRLAASFNVTLEAFRQDLERQGIYDEYLRLYRRQLMIESYLETVIDVDVEEDEALFFEKMREHIEYLKSQADLRYR